MSVVNIGKEAGDEFFTGHGTVGVTEAPVSAVNLQVKKHVIVRATAGNTNTISVGPPGHSSAGFILAAGEQTPPIYVDQTDKVALVGGAAGQNYSWIAQ